MLLMIFINKIREYCKNSFLIDLLINYSIFQLFENFTFLKAFDSEFSYIEVWFTDQNSNPLEIEDKINITLVIN